MKIQFPENNLVLLRRARFLLAKLPGCSRPCDSSTSGTRSDYGVRYGFPRDEGWRAGDSFRSESRSQCGGFSPRAEAILFFGYGIRAVPIQPVVLRNKAWPQV